MNDIRIGDTCVLVVGGQKYDGKITSKHANEFFGPQTGRDELGNLDIDKCQTIMTYAVEVIE